MKKVLLFGLILLSGFFFSACEKKKTVDEQLKENTVKEAELIKKSVSKKADKLGDAIQKDIDKLKK